MSSLRFLSNPITDPHLQTICFKYFPFFLKFELTRNHFYQRIDFWYYLHYSLAKEFGHQNQLRCEIDDQKYKICSNYLLSVFVKETGKLFSIRIFKFLNF